MLKYPSFFLLCGRHKAFTISECSLRNFALQGFYDNARDAPPYNYRLLMKPDRLNKSSLFYFDSYTCSLTSSYYLARLTERYSESRHDCGEVGIALSFPFGRKVLTTAINYCPPPTAQL